MKRILIFIMFLLCMITCACSIGDNKPEDAVEILFERYRNKDDDIINQLKEVVTSEKLMDNQKQEYQELMERQYDRLGYVIKDIDEDIDTAVVIVEITVLNYRDAIEMAEAKLKETPEIFNDKNNNFSEEKYMDYKINLMNQVDDTITYTLELNLYKEKGMWMVDRLSSNDISKIHGLY